MPKLSERKPKSKIKKKKSKEHKSEKIEYPKPLDFDNVKLYQTDLWMLNRYFFGEDTRLTKNELLPKFADFFNKKNQKLKKRIRHK